MRLVCGSMDRWWHSSSRIRHTMTVIRPLLPHPAHLLRTRLKVAKVLLTQARLFVDFDRVPRERRWLWIVGCQFRKHPLGRLASSQIRADEQVDCVCWPEELAELPACFMGLLPSFGRERDSVVRCRLMDLSIFVALAIPVNPRQTAEVLGRCGTSDCACRTIMMSLGFPMLLAVWWKALSRSRGNRKTRRRRAGNLDQNIKHSVT